MIFTDEERKLARNLCEDKAVILFLEKLFAPEEGFGGDIEKNVVALDDADYGRMMKVLYIGREHFKGRLALLRQLGAQAKRTGIPIAPK